MIPYKELSGLYFVENVTFKKAKSKYYTSRESMAVYSANTVYTKKGICVLVVCLYKASKQEDNWTICERHFLTQNGEMAGEEYLGDGEFRRGDFKIGNSDYTFSNWYDTLSRNLLGRYSTAYVFPYKEADKEIGRFVKRYDAFSGYDAHDADFEPMDMLSWLAQYQDDLISQKKNEAETRRRKRIQDIMAPYSEPPEEVSSWVFGERLTAAPWFYIYNHRRVQKGKCGACRKISEIREVVNKKKAVCPQCGAEIVFVNAVSKQFMYDNGNKASWKISKDIVYHQVIDSGKFLSRYFWAHSQYSYDLKSQKIRRVDKLFETRRDFWKCENSQAVIEQIYELQYERWERLRVKYSRYYGLGESYTKNLPEVLKATGIERLKHMDITALFEKWERHIAELINGLYRYPVVENIAKEGMFNIARHIATCGTNGVNAFANSNKPYKFLGISRTVIPAFADIDIEPFQLCEWQRLGLTDKDLNAFCGLCEISQNSFTKVLHNVDKYRLTIERIGNYLRKQAVRLKREISDTAMLWNDYIDMAEKLGIGLKQDKELLFPPDIGKEHDRCVKLVEIKETEKRREGLKKRAELLDVLEFSDENYLIRPLRTVDEFIEESRVLDHCVKTYIDRHISGSSNIFGLRKVSEPDKPYFTVNISSNGRLIENRGLHNCAPGDDVKKFVNKWLKVVETWLKKNPIKSASEQLEKKGA